MCHVAPRLDSPLVGLLHEIGASLLAGRFRRVLGKGAAGEGKGYAPTALARIGQGIAQIGIMDAATLPTGI